MKLIMCFKVPVLFVLIQLILAECAEDIIPKPTVCSIGNDANFEKDATDIHDILGGKHHTRLKYILTNRNCNERVKIRESYDKKYDKEKKLMDRIKHKLQDRCQDIVYRSLMNFNDIRYFDLSLQFYDFNVIVDVLCTLTRKQFNSLNNFMYQNFQKSLQAYVGDEAVNWNSDAREKVLNYCVKRHLDTDVEWCRNNTPNIINTFNSQNLSRGTFETTLDGVLKHCKNNEIAKIAVQTNLLDKVRNILHKSSVYKFVAEPVVYSSMNIVEYIANGYHEAVLGSGTEHSFIIRRTVMTSTNILGNIKEAYEKMFNGKKLKDRLRQEWEIKHDDCYREILEEYLRDPRDPPCAAETDPWTTTL